MSVHEPKLDADPAGPYRGEGDLYDLENWCRFFINPRGMRLLRRRFLRAQLEIFEGFREVTRAQLEDLEKGRPAAEKIRVE